jgi:putative ABC transport system substrate-binding protein
MGRRCFLVAVLLLAVAASAAEPPIVGIYGWGTDPTARISRWDRFYSRLRELGWRDGENVRLQPRYGARDDAKGDAILREFVRAQVAVIVVTGTGEALAAQRATSTIPVVVLHMLDPVKLGLIQSLARPGGNITGRVQTVSGVSGKQLELIAQTIPSAGRAVYGRGATGSKEHGEEISAAAKSLGLAYLESDLPRDRNFEPWVGQMKRVGVDVAVFILDGLTFPPPHNAALAAALIKHKLPAICAASEYADAGCLMSYGPVTLDHYARGAEFVDRILKGAKPADLPVEQPTRFELVLNFKTARARPQVSTRRPHSRRPNHRMTRVGRRQAARRREAQSPRRAQRAIRDGVGARGSLRRGPRPAGGLMRPGVCCLAAANRAPARGPRFAAPRARGPTPSRIHGAEV